MSPVTRTAVSIATATFALLLWGMLYWMFLFELTGVYATSLAGGDAVAAALADAGAQTGTYFYPPRHSPIPQETFVSAHASGPFFEVRYVDHGIDPQNPIKMLWGTLHHLLLVGMAAGILWLAAAPSAARRFGIVLLAGLLGTVFIQWGDPIWFHLPWDYALGITLYEGVGWVLVAGILAWGVE